MMIEDRIEKFRQIIEKKEYASVITEFTLAERERLIELILSDYIVDMDIEIIKNLKIFTDYEVKHKLGDVRLIDENFFESDDIDEKMFYLMALSDADKEIILNNFNNLDNAILLVVTMISDQIKLKYFNLGVRQFGV